MQAILQASYSQTRCRTQAEMPELRKGLPCGLRGTAFSPQLHPQRLPAIPQLFQLDVLKHGGGS